jgi:predicted nuclease of predicted toxin-antitoxin system
MRIFADHDVYKITVDNLRKWGYDVTTAQELNMHRSADEELLAKANETNRLLITRDKECGAFVFLK